MNAELRYCNGTYVRDPEGTWRYTWGGAVPGALDLTLADLLAIDHPPDASTIPMDARPVSRQELEWLRDENHENVLVRRNSRGAPTSSDLIVGMSAPELQVHTMLTVGDIATLAKVSKATIDSYRYRGYLPTPQSVRGRTPLWSRPVIQRWLQTRPGCGWRSDIYGNAADRDQHEQVSRKRTTTPHTRARTTPGTQNPTTTH